MSPRPVLDLEEWDLVLAKMNRYHSNISQEVAIIVQTIRKEMKADLVPLAEEKANFGKIVKNAIREMWSLEYEIVEIQTEFAKGIGSVDINHLTDDFVEDVMLQSKPLQGILMAIRLRQKKKMEEIKEKYWESVKDLEPQNLARPPPTPEAPEVKVEEKKEEAKPAEPSVTEKPVSSPVTEVSA
jgi:hypothetical protein